MRESTQQKADRLLSESRVGVSSPALMFPVVGDSGVHYVTIETEGMNVCTCPAQTTCSHILACLEKIRREGENA